MTKLARVIFVNFIIFLSISFPNQVSAGFANLLEPLPDNKEAINTLEGSEQSTNPPSITFGDLLNNFSSLSLQEPAASTDELLMAQKTERFKKLLATLEENYKVSLAQFRAKTSNSITHNLQLTTHNENPPSAIIPIPTLVANVSALTNYNLKPKTFYPTPTLTDQLLLASIDNPNLPSPQPTIYNPSTTLKISPQPTTNVLGTLTQNPLKTTYTVALLGDSMTDTLGMDLPHLRTLLTDEYPGYTFALLNYGQGATDMESGLYRLTNSTKYLDRDYPPLLSYKPDILVVESFAYNHWSGEKYDLDRQWLTIAKIIDTVRQNSPDTKIVLAATITPNKDIFGDGVLNWPKVLKEQSTLIIKAYLQNMVNFATTQGYPLADAYHPSLQADGEGTAAYISSYDHLHPSGDGAYLYSKKIVEAIKNNALIN